MIGRLKLLAAICAASLSTSIIDAASIPFDGGETKVNQGITDSIDIFDLDFDTNIATPKVSGKQHEAIKNYMHSVATSLYKKSYKVETERGGEVVIITILTDDLFLPNDTLLMQQASHLLKPLVQFVDDTKFKTVFAIHSDDTGSESYQEKLTDLRTMAIYNWFDSNANDASMFVGYPMGGSDPIAPNDSRANRRANRRMELYLIPSLEMIDLAKSKKLLQD